MRKTSLYLDDEQADRLARLARAEGRPQAEIVREAIACYRPRPKRDRNFAVAGNFDPGFYVRHFLKDMRIALAEAKGLGIRLPGLQLAQELYRKLEESGRDKLGTQALYKVLEEMAGG